MQGDPKKRQALYEGLVKDGYALGSYDEFEAKMQDPKRVRALYDGITKDGYDVGDFDSFSIKVGPDSFQKTPPPQVPPQSVGGGGVPPTPLAAPSQPSAPATVPGLTGVRTNERFTSGFDEAGDAVLASPVRRGLIQPQQVQEQLIAKVAERQAAPRVFTQPPAVVDDMGDGVTTSLPTTDAVDPRWERVLADYRTSGRAKHTPEFIAEQVKAGKWTAADDAELKQRAIMHQVGLVNDRSLVLSGATKALAEGPVKQIDDEMTGLKDRLLAMQQQAQVSGATEQMQAEFAGLASRYNELKAQRDRVLEPVLKEAEELDAARKYLSEGLVGAEARMNQDPDYRARRAMQAYADAEWKEAKKLVDRGDYINPTVVDQYILRPISMEIRRFGGNAGAGLTRAASRLSKAVTPGDKNLGTVVLDDVADWFSENLENLSAREPSKLKESIFTDDGGVNEGALPKFMKAATYMGLLAGSGYAGGAAGMSGVSMLANSDDYYREAVDAGMSEGEAEAFALAMSGVETGVELVNLGPFVNGGGRKQIAREAIAALKAGKPMTGATQEIAKYALKQGVMEGPVEETVTSLAQNALKMGANMATGADLNTDLTVKDLAEGAVIGGVLGAFSAGGSQLAQRPMYKESVRWAVDHEAEFMDLVRKSVPQEQQQLVVDEFDKYRRIFKGLPPAMPKAAANTIATAIREKERIKEEQSQATIDDTVAAAIGDTYADRIKEQDEIIAKELGIDLTAIARKQEVERLQDQYDKAKLKSEVTGTPMPEGMTRPKDEVIEVKEVSEQPSELEPTAQPSAATPATEAVAAVGEETTNPPEAGQTSVPESLTKESLKEAFGYTDEVADATIAIADAMGLDKSKIKVEKGGESSPDALFQQEADGWRSRLTEVVKAKGQTQPASQWAAWLQSRAKEGALSMDEAKWTGLQDWLASKGNERVSPQDVQKFLDENRVKVEVKELSANDLTEAELERMAEEQARKDMLAVGRFYDQESGPAKTHFFVEALERLREEREGERDDTKFSQYQLPGGPLSRDTEILTDSGWTRIDAVQIGQRVLTRKDEGGELEWQPILAKPSVFAQELYHFKNQSIDMMVTADHKMVVKRRRRSSGGIIRMTAKKLWASSEMLVPLTGLWSGGDDEKMFGLDAGDVAEFMGWYIAEGSYKHQNGYKHTLQIAQCDKANPDKCDRISLLMDRLGLSYKYYAGAFGVRTRGMNPGLKDMAHQQPTSGGKYIPSIFFSASKRVIDRLLEGLVLGDGCIRKAGRGRVEQTMYFTKSKRLAGDVQALAVLSGKRATVRQRKSGLYAVHIAHKEWCSIDDAKYAVVPYNDTAFCVTVENHAIYVRRNGVAAFTGNSNYREVLVTLPVKRGELPPGWRVQRMDDAAGNERWVVTDQNGNSVWSASSRSSAVSGAWDLDTRASRSSGEFRSSHYDEPNILFHLRVNDRTDAQGKRVLFIEEIQSDWAQKGRKEGFGPKGSEQELRAESNRLRDEMKAVSVIGDKDTPPKPGMEAVSYAPTYAVWATPENAERWNELNDKREEVERKREALRRTNTIPSAPFVTDTSAWVELAIKQAVRMAVEGNYDRVAWTTGEQQYGRWGSQVFSWTKKGGSWYVHGQEQSGGDAFAGMEEQLRQQAFDEGRKADSKGDLRDIVEATMGRERSDWAPDRWKEYIDKITDGIWQDIKDGKEGSTMPRREGMKGFYDKIVPTVASKVIKKMGGKVGETVISKDAPSKNYASPPVVSGREMTQPSFDITPEMKAEVQKGLPLYQNSTKDQAFNGTEEPKTPIGNTKTVTVDGKERTVFNSNGKPIHPTVEGVRNFWRWFKDSKVVDEQGRPLVVYHGSASDFDAFSNDRLAQNTGARTASLGHFFSSSKETADTFHGRQSGGGVYPVYLSIGNPVVERSDLARGRETFLTVDGRYLQGIRRMSMAGGVEVTKDAYSKLNDYIKWATGSHAKFRDKSMELGYDGVVLENTKMDSIGDIANHYIAFDPTQIKSVTGNYGTFDPSNPSIVKQDNKGSVEFTQGGEAIIRALKNPDASTGIHELAHVARRFLFDTSIPQENRQGITDEHIKTAEQWSGAKDGNWTREAEEKFARGFERYLRDGKAPTEALKGVFDKFAQWLREIYQNLFTSPVKELVSPEMRKVFDALVQRGEMKASAKPPVETLTKPTTLFRGQDGKRTAEGERMNVHKGAEGLFATEDKGQAEAYGSKTGVSNIELPAGTTVETIRVGGSVTDLREREIKAINESKADVVKLITVDGDKAGRQTQWVLKNKALWPKRPEKKPEPKPEKKEEQKTKEQSQTGMETHATALRIKEQYPELYKAMDERDGKRGILYHRLPNEVSIDAARELVGWLGTEAAMDAVTNPSNGLPNAIRVFMGRMVIKRYLDEAATDSSKMERAAKAAEELAEVAKDLGQGVQAFRDMPEMFSPELILYREKKRVREAGEQLLKRKNRSGKVDKLKKELRRANEESIERVLTGPSTKGKVVQAATPIKGSPPPGINKERIKKALNWDSNKVVTKARRAEIRKALQGTFSSNLNPLHVELAAGYIEAGVRSFSALAEELTKEFGRKAVPYFKEAYKEAYNYLKARGIDAGEPDSDAAIDEVVSKVNTQLLVEDLKKAIAKRDNKRVNELMAQLQQSAKDYDVWGLYQDYASDRIKRMAENEIREDLLERDELREFADGLVRNITAQLREEEQRKGIEPKERKKQKTDIEIIGDAFKNFDKYKDTWNETREKFSAKLRAANARLEKAETPEAKAEAELAISREEAKLIKLDEYFGDLMLKPFSSEGMGRAVRKGLKDLDVRISDIIRAHYTVQMGTAMALADRLKQEAGLDGPEAVALAKEVQRKFDEIATAAKLDIIRRMTTKSDRKRKSPERKGLEQSLLELTNIGAFSDEDFLKAYSKEMGWPELSAENIKKLHELSDAVQRAPEGRPRLEATQDLLTYQETMHGVSFSEVMQAVWYANVLSGYQTQEVNFIANAIQIATEFGVSMAKNPKAVPDMAKAIAYGFSRGGQEAVSTLKTGYSPIKGEKTSALPTLERINFGSKLRAKDNPISRKFGQALWALNGLKTPGRVMTAADVLFFEAAREMRAQQWAMKMAKDGDPTQSQRDKALALMNKDSLAIALAETQAQDEYDDEVAVIEDSGMSAAKKEKALKKAIRDRARRKFELIEKGRDMEIKEEAARFAARATYNYAPEGTLGALAAAMNAGLRAVPPLRYIVPFVNIIANVANESLNYSPLGYIRAAAGGSIGAELWERSGMTPPTKALKKPDLTPRQYEALRQDLLVKASMGVGFAATMLALSNPDDKDKWWYIEITGNGKGSYRNNQTMEQDAGWQPYSIRVGDTWISYQYTPFIHMLSLIGHYRDVQKYRPEQLDDKFYTQWSIAAGRASASLMDASFLGAVKDILTFIGNESGEGFADNMVRTFARIAKSFVIPALYTQTAREIQYILDTPMKDTRGDFYGYIVQDLPWLRDDLLTKRNVFGDPIPPEGGFLGRFLSTQKSDPIAQLITKHGWSPGAPSPLSLHGEDPVTLKDRMFTKEEQEEFFIVRGTQIKEYLNANMDRLMKLPKKEFTDEMEKVLSGATLYAKYKALGWADE